MEVECLACRKKNGKEEEEEAEEKWRACHGGRDMGGGCVCWVVWVWEGEVSNLASLLRSLRPSLPCPSAMAGSMGGCRLGQARCLDACESLDFWPLLLLLLLLLLILFSSNRC